VLDSTKQTWRVHCQKLIKNRSVRKALIGFPTDEAPLRQDFEAFIADFGPELR
jgi:hypothetical protein